MQRIVATFAVALGLLAGAAGTATADTTYPDGITPFTAGADGWIDAGASCSLIVLPSALCAVENVHVAGDGRPPGAIATRYSTAVGLLTLASGTGTWRSPAFTVAGPGPVEGVQLRFDRRALIKALLDVGGSAKEQVSLVDVTDPAAPRTVAAVAEDLGASATFGATEQPWQTRTRTFPAETVALGRTYRLELRTTFSSLLQAALGSIEVRYDNVGATVADATTTGEVPPVVDTLPPTSVRADGATLNGTVDPRGTQTDEVAFELKDPAGTVSTSAVDGVGSGVGPVERSTAVTGLTQCTRYEVTLRARNARNAEGQFSRGAAIPFTTDCAPSAETLPAGPISATTAFLNGAVTPNGRATAYRYAYGTSPEQLAAVTPVRTLEAAREGRAPLSEPLAGLAPQTVYFAQVYATNDLGTTAGGVVSFTTPPLTGPAGPAGADGKNGRNGSSGTSGSSTTVGNGDARALLRIRSALVRVGTAGRRAGQIRFPISCRRAAGRTCAGTVKLRTLQPINPSSRPGVRKAKRRVTLATFEYQLAAGKRGFAIAQMQPEKVDLMRRLGRVAISISVQVTDAGGNRQTVVRSGAMRAQRTV